MPKRAMDKRKTRFTDGLIDALQIEEKTCATRKVIQIVLVLTIENLPGNAVARRRAFEMKDNQAAVPVLPLTQNKQPTFSGINRDPVADLKSHFRLKIFRCGSIQ